MEGESNTTSVTTYRRNLGHSPATTEGNGNRLLSTPHCDRRSAIADGCCSASQNDSLIGSAACDSSDGRAARGRFAALQHPKLRRGPLASGHRSRGRGSALTRRLEIATRATHGRARPSTRRGPLDLLRFPCRCAFGRPSRLSGGERKRCSTYPVGLEGEEARS